MENISPVENKQPKPFHPAPAPQRFHSTTFGDDTNFQCGFVTHVQSATLLIGSFGSLAFTGVLASLVRGGAESEHAALIGMILCSYALLVLGWIFRMPSLYWPFLMLNPLMMGLCAIFCIYPALDTLLTPSVYPLEHISPKQQLLMNVTRSLRMMELISSLCAIFLLGYFQSVVFRAHNWQRKKNRLDEQLVIISDQTP